MSLHTGRMLPATALLLSLAGCGPSGNASPDPLPVRLPELGAVSVPADNGASVDPTPFTAHFATTWLYGREPFTVVWDFGAPPPDPPFPPGIIDETTSNRESVRDLLLIGGPEEVTLTGSVTVTDANGESDSAAFTYTLHLAAP